MTKEVFNDRILNFLMQDLNDIYNSNLIPSKETLKNLLLADLDRIYDK